MGRLDAFRWVTRFMPVSTRETNYYMTELCRRFNYLWDQSPNERLLISLALIFDFLCIHPFSDGNGRVSRLLTVLLFHKLGFDVTRYVSLEKLIEDSKESYYDVLRRVSEGWHAHHHHLLPWFEYHVALLLKAYGTLREQVNVVDAGRGEKTAWVLEVIEKQLPSVFSMGDLSRLCPDVSRPMLRHVLQQLRNEGKVKLVGLGRGARWKKKG